MSQITHYAHAGVVSRLHALVPWGYWGHTIPAFSAW
jgi:hypothetical protein